MIFICVQVEHRFQAMRDAFGLVYGSLQVLMPIKMVSVKQVGQAQQTLIQPYLKSILSRLNLIMNQVTPHKKNHSHMMAGLLIHSQNLLIRKNTIILLMVTSLKVKQPGDAAVLNEKAVLSSGSKTDTISQLIDIKQRMTYTISADIETDGTEVTIGARKKNGTFNSSQTFNKSGHVEVSFVTDAGSSQQMEAYAQVLRYQQGAPVKVDNIKVTSGKASTVIPTPTPKPDVFQLVANGEFDEGDKNWKLSGSTIIENGHAVLASGSDTDGLSQKISVEGGKTYTLTANVISSGTNIDVGIRDYNGRYTNIHQTFNKSGTMTLTFTTAKHIKEVELYAEVVRYQSNNNPVYLDSIVLKEGKEEITPDQPEIPEIPVSGLLNNGTFTQGNSYWTLGGSASISLGKAILTSGCDTDTISQKVSVETGKTYKLTCDIESDGCNVDLMIQGHDGKYSNKKLSYSTNTKGELVFTVGKVHSESKVVIQVLRYQNGSVKVSNIQLEEMK